MSGISDLPFRMLNRKFGCEFAFIEMINVRSVSGKSRRTKEMLTPHSKDSPLGLQLLGCEPGYIRKAMDVIRRYKFDVLDFNAACPVKKVTRRGEGASLLLNPARLKQLIKQIVDNSQLPVTLKIRTGWDKASVNAKEVALMAEDSGIKALFIHGRTKTQGYSGEVDYQTIKEVKRSLKIPVIASGNNFSAQLAKRMLDETGCDGVVFARGALGNPWIFRQAEALLKGNKILPHPQLEEIIETMIEHLNGCIDFYGERIGVMKFRKFFSWYTKGLRKIRPLREKSSRAKKKEEMVGIIAECKSRD